MESASEADAELRDTALRETSLSSKLDVPASETAEEDPAHNAEEFIISTMNNLDETGEMQRESAFEEDYAWPTRIRPVSA